MPVLLALARPSAGVAQRQSTQASLFSSEVGSPFFEYCSKRSGAPYGRCSFRFGRPFLLNRHLLSASPPVRNLSPPLISSGTGFFAGIVTCLLFCEPPPSFLCPQSGIGDPRFPFCRRRLKRNFATPTFHPFSETLDFLPFLEESPGFSFFPFLVLSKQNKQDPCDVTFP